MAAEEGEAPGATEAGRVRAGAGADDRALAWHAHLWDSGFLVWGILAGSAMLLGRASSGKGQLRASDPRPRPPMSA